MAGMLFPSLWHSHANSCDHESCVPMSVQCVSIKTGSAAPGF